MGVLRRQFAVIAEVVIGLVIGVANKNEVSGPPM